MKLLLIFFIAVIVITAIQTFSNSLLARRSHGVLEKQYRAKMNMYMGIMFIAIAVMQLISLHGSWFRLALLLVILALGFINLFYGWRNWRYYANKEDSADGSN